MALREKHVPVQALCAYAAERQEDSLAPIITEEKKEVTGFPAQQKQGFQNYMT